MSLTAGDNGKVLDQTSVKNKRALIFIHLPKTAGTTLGRIIEFEYNPLKIYTVDPYFIRWSNAHLSNLPAQRLAKFEVFKGHLGFGLHEKLPQTSTYITVLRDPIDRAISTYYFMSTYVLHPRYRQIKRAGWTLEDFIQKFPRNNIQCKYLTGADWDAECNQAMCEQAKHNLANYFSVVGISERFDETLALMKLEFGWKLSTYSSFNKTKRRPKKHDVAGSTIQLICDYNRFDLELYSFGQALFQKKLDGRHDEVTRLVLHFRAHKANTFSHLLYGTNAAIRKAISRIHSAL